MKYYIQRGINEYGPYTLADLQRYVAQGNISPNDLTRSEGMTEWAPVSQVVGNIPPPAPPAAVTAAWPTQGGTVYGGTPAVASPAAAYGAAASPAAVAGPVPPDLHWALVWLIGAFTCNIFQLVWLFVEVGFVKKIRPASNCLAFLITSLCVQLGSFVVLFAGMGVIGGFSESRQPPNGPTVIVAVLFYAALLAGGVLSIVAIFKTRSALVEYYNTVEPIHLRLSGVMTFFFSIFYFQYHFSRIAAWKRTGYLAPQAYQG